MKKIKYVLRLICPIILIFVLSSGSVNGEDLMDNAEATDSQTFMGYIIDEDCFVNPDYADPATETRGCQLMPNCAASGYGIAVLESNGEYRFYYFDGDISTVSKGARIENATKGQQKAWLFLNENLIDANIPVIVRGQLNTDPTNISVAVTGALTNATRTNPDPRTADGIEYSVITVDSITAIAVIPTFEAEFTGYLVDAQSFLKAETEGGDFTAQTKTQLSSVESAESGYGMAVAQKDGTYKFYYFEGDFAPDATMGQQRAAEILSFSTKTDHILVDVTGDFKGRFSSLKVTGPEYRQYPYPVIDIRELSETPTDYTPIMLGVLILIAVAAAAAFIIKRKFFKN
ncbi:MAG: hypothetical protein ACOH15_08190 [Acetobacterium sp.]